MLDKDAIDNGKLNPANAKNDCIDRFSNLSLLTNSKMVNH